MQHSYKNCGCTEGKVRRIVLGLGREEIEDMIKTQGGAEIICQFCGREYKLNKTQLQELLEKAAKSEC